MICDTKSLETMLDYIRWGASCFATQGLFFGHGTDNALDESVALVLHALKLRHDLPSMYLQSRLTAPEKEAIEALFKRRIKERVPAPYITNEVMFAGFSFYVDEHVLVPRSPIAELIENHFQPWIGPERVTRILDLCTGSGCIGIACAHQFPQASVDLPALGRGIGAAQIADFLAALGRDRRALLGRGRARCDRRQCDRDQ